MPKQSAGILLFRRTSGQLEVLLVHPGGPFWAKKDAGAWSIPKGEYDNQEDPLEAAKRELEEETGVKADGPLLPLGLVRQSAAKQVSAWALEMDLDAEAIKSNLFSMEWPPGSGKLREFPEADRAAWFSIDAARSKILKGQIPFLERLAAMGAAGPRRILVHGHRGARAGMPENTIPAFEYAIRAGADVLELDMAVTKDDVIVVSHNPVLQPPTCSAGQPPAAIRQLTYADVRRGDCARMPSLDEVFALAPRGSFEFHIETKIFPDRPELAPAPERFVRLVLEMIRKHNLERRVILQSFDFRTLKVMEQLAPGIRRSALYEGPSRDFVEIAREAGAQIVSPEHPLVTPERVRAAHQAGLQVVPWTANTPAEWDALVAAGVDAIITDDPAALIGYLRSLGLR